MKARIAVIAALIPLAMGISGCGSAAPAQHATGTPPPASRQSVLPFTGLEGPHDVSVDTTGIRLRLRKRPDGEAGQRVRCAD
jgi:hypothetical protein